VQVEHVIRNKNDIHALEIVQLFCDLLLARHMLLESEPGCPMEMQVRRPPPPPAATPPPVLRIDSTRSAGPREREQEV
jgi:hypothetical protein